MNFTEETDKIVYERLKSIFMKNWMKTPDEDKMVSTKVDLFMPWTEYGFNERMEIVEVQTGIVVYPPLHTNSFAFLISEYLHGKYKEEG